jgi:hypothetical protein
MRAIESVTPAPSGKSLTGIRMTDKVMRRDVGHSYIRRREAFERGRAFTPPEAMAFAIF